MVTLNHSKASTKTAKSPASADLLRFRIDAPRATPRTPPSTNPTYTYDFKTESHFAPSNTGFNHCRLKHPAASPPTNSVVALLSRDPIGYRGSNGNLYEFVDGRSLVATDPSGLVACTSTRVSSRGSQSFALGGGWGVGLSNGTNPGVYTPGQPTTEVQCVRVSRFVYTYDCKCKCYTATETSDDVLIEPFTASIAPLFLLTHGLEVFSIGPEGVIGIDIDIPWLDPISVPIGGPEVTFSVLDAGDMIYAENACQAKGSGMPPPKPPKAPPKSHDCYGEWFN